MNFLDSLKNYLNASYPSLWVQTHEEVRVCMDIYNNFKKTHKIYQWDCVDGLSLRTDKAQPAIANSKTLEQAFICIKALVETTTDECIIIIKDFHLQIISPTKRADYIRYVKSLLPRLKSKNCMVIMISPIVNIPIELNKDIQLLDYALPNEAAIADRLDYIYASANSKSKGIVLTAEIREKAIEAAKGLTFSEAENAFALGITTHKQYNEAFVAEVFTEKIQQVKKGGLLTYVNSDISFADVGGLEGIKSWIKVRRKGYSKKARDYKLPFPKGFLAAGIPGCGKTLLAKATAKEFGFPLFQVDLSRLFNSKVGGTENNFIELIKTIEGIGQCVILIDEIEKYLNENAVSGAGDSGTSSRSFGTLLTWLSDRNGPVFLIATSNDHTILPSALKRKGRFDEIFWVDLPSDKERADIWNVVIKKYNRDPKNFLIPNLVKASKGFTGIEIDEAFASAMYYSFTCDMEVCSEIVEKEVSKLVPQSKSDEVSFKRMREEAKTLRPASDLPILLDAESTDRKLKL